MTDIEAVVARCCDAAWSQNYSIALPRRKPRMMRALATLRPGDPLPGGNVVAQGWRPIEEAPRDGEFDVWISGPGARRVPDCRWGKPSHANWGDRYGDDANLPEQIITRIGTALDRRNGVATHWAPRLPPPTPEASDGIMTKQETEREAEDRT